MNDQSLRRAIGVMGTLLVVVLGATLVLMLSKGGSGGSGGAAVSAQPSGVAAVSPSPSVTPSASVSASVAPSSSASPESSPSLIPTTAPIPSAMLTLVGIKLDAADDLSGQDRVITFTSDGPGTVKMALASQTSKGTTIMCFRVGTKLLGCKDWANGSFNGKTSQAHTDWTVTVRGSGIATPVVDVTVTFAAVAPEVKIAHARFNGTSEPSLNGIQVRFAPRADGLVRLVASWGGHAFVYEIDTFDETTGSAGPSYPDQGPATNVDRSSPVSAGDTWRVVLQNAETGFGTTDLTATISWP